MDCPRCKAPKKLTANESIGVAKCWKCNAAWTENSGKHLGSWAINLARGLAEQCQNYLPQSDACLEWLTDKRGLPNDVKWLQAHYLGALPGNLETSSLISRAREHMEQDTDEALELATKDAVIKRIEKEHEEQLKRLDRFAEKLNPLQNPMWKDSVVYIYVDHQFQPISLNVRQYKLERKGDPQKHCQRVQPVLGKRGVFCPVPEPGVGWGHNFPTLIVEGEHNWLSLCKASDGWNADGRYALSGFAVGGKNGSDVPCIKKLAGRRPVVLYDNDKVDKKTGKVGGYALVKSITNRLSVYAATTPTKDADDWCKTSEVLPAQLRELVTNAEFVPQPPDAVADAIREIRNTPKTKEWEIVEQVSPLLWENLNERALAYNAGEGSKPAQGILMVECEKGRKLVEVSPKHPTWNQLMLDYGIESADKLANQLSANIWTRTLDCPRVKLNILSHYSRTSKKLYFDMGDGSVLVIHPDGTTSKQSNGDDGVVFLPHTVHPPENLKEVEGVGLGRTGGWFDKLISSTVQWDGETGMPEADQKLLLRVHVMQLFYDSLISMKLPPVFEGPGGAGKNTVTTRIGRFLEGASFAVQHMPKDEKTLNEKSSFRLYAGFDEYDSGSHEMESAFRSWCTTMFYETRKLYTNFEMAVAPLARGASLSTNYNPAKEAATGRRQLTFFVKERPVQDGYRSPAADLWPEFDRLAPELWAEVIADLRVITKGLAEIEPMNVSHSMSDFAVFMRRCARFERWEDDAVRILNDLNELQQQVLADKSFWANMIMTVVYAHPELVGELHTAKEWCNWMREVTNPADRDTQSRIVEGKFGLYCSRSGRATMERAVGMKIPDGKIHNAVQYLFTPPGHVIERVVESTVEATA
jgi:hypothetical protein